MYTFGAPRVGNVSFAEVRTHDALNSQWSVYGQVRHHHSCTP